MVQIFTIEVQGKNSRIHFLALDFEELNDKA